MCKIITQLQEVYNNTICDVTTTHYLKTPSLLSDNGKNKFNCDVIILKRCNNIMNKIKVINFEIRYPQSNLAPM